MPFYFAAGEIPAAEKLGSYDSFTPTLTAAGATPTNPNLGADGFALGDYFVNGFLVTVFVRILFSGTGVSAGTGTYEIQMPFPANSSLGSILGSATIGSGTSVGSGIARPTSGSTGMRTVQVYFVTGAGGRVRLFADTATGGVDNTFGWATGGRITFSAQYPADPASLP